MKPEGDWRVSLTRALASDSHKLHLVGVGNSIRSDDAAGLEVVKSVKRKVGSKHRKDVVIHGPTLSPEGTLSKIPSAHRVLIFDSVDAGESPGTIVFATLGQSKYGYFASHNVPLKLIPGLMGRSESVMVVGIQPASLEVGEGLSPEVKVSVDEIAAVVSSKVGEKR
jgi:hydrogenase maturation protease